MTRRTFPSLIAVALIVAARWAWSDELENRHEADKHALSTLQAYVGQWRGVGQLKRGSSRGAWTESVAWSWHFSKTRAELVAEISNGKYFSRLRVRAGDRPGQFVLFAHPPAADENAAPAEPLRFVGGAENGLLVLVADEAAAGVPARITVRLVAGGNRMVVLYEQRLGESVYTRLGEVGLTRKGSAFATTAASGPECVVTGGQGTIAVEHGGQTYFVCCDGCRDLFNDDPVGTLAEYRQRKAAEKARREAGD